MTILVTGGAGFIGSNFVLDWLAASNEPVVNLDKLTYAGHLESLKSIEDDPRHIFVKGDIGDIELVTDLLHEHRIRAVINLAAETHVDRSIRLMEDFVQTNIVGTSHLLEACRQYFAVVSEEKRMRFRFLHVSTDEVFGSLEEAVPAFTESSPYLPSSPYAASKAAADHLVRSMHRTHGLPAITTRCSNNYGPYQYPEKLVPIMIHNALSGKPLPLYGDGMQIRDWLHVKDHCSALRLVLERGKIGRTYNIGGLNQKRNIEVVMCLCRILDELCPREGGGSYSALLSFVADRPGHDRRYAIDATRIWDEMGWVPSIHFETGLKMTVEWYLENTAWIERVSDEKFHQWIKKQYA
ncbi:MAG: dTDP-glucose 4,6-dehydratase [Oxalobacter sp.]|nr:dTDP-glucose 4,6-dehydratase [Oxalobacter sp.]